MAGLVESVREILSIPEKTRYDSLSDRYNRIFMVKMLTVGTLFLGFNWYADRIHCIVSSTDHLSSDFVSEACWTQGFYIYESVLKEKDTVAYYGIPSNLDNDGRFESNGKFCASNTARANVRDPDCIPMEKTFFVQYQYMPFFIASLCLLYYIPYIVFRMVNRDLVSLKIDLKTAQDVGHIMETYFCRTSDSHTNKMRVKVIINYIIKIGYILSNLSSFFLVNEIFNGRFVDYGFSWSIWNSMGNEIAYDYMGITQRPRPGNIVMPTFGICEVII